MSEPKTLAEVRERAAINVWPTAGRLLGLGKNATWAAVHRGEIPSITIGGRTLVPVPPLLRLIGDQPDEESR